MSGINLLDSPKYQSTLTAGYDDQATLGFSQRTCHLKAATYTRYGPPEVVTISEIQKPSPKPNEILIRIRATTLNSGDARMRRSDFGSPLFTILGRLMLGIRKPRKQILGTTLAGEVESLGDIVTGFNVADKVFASAGMTFGAHAQYITIPQDSTVLEMPENLSFEQAASIPFGGFTALHFLRKLTTIKPNQRILINGAAGGVGSSAVQLAKHDGAHVTAVCSASHAEFVKSIGADETIDYNAEDFRQRSDTYDIIFDTVGKLSFSKCKRSLNKNGRFLAADMNGPIILQMLWTKMMSNKKLISGVALDKPEHLKTLKDLVESGAIKPTIDRTYPFDEIQQAHKFVDTGHKSGSIVITMYDI